MEDKVVSHSGIKGMRWGVRRYQNKDGSLTPAGRKRYGDGGSDGNDSDKGNGPSKKQTSKQSEEELAKEREEFKKRAINSGDINEVMKYRGNMTTDELRKALDRVDLEQKVQKISSSKESGMLSRITKSDVRNMSKQDLQDNVERLKQEQQYWALRESVSDKSRSAVSKSLEKIGVELLTSYGKKAAEGSADAALKKLASKSQRLDTLFKQLKWIP